MRRPAAALLVAGLLIGVACGGGSAGKQDVASIIHRLIVASGGSDTGQLVSYTGRLPDSLPARPPEYPGSGLIVSMRRPASTNLATPSPTAGTIAQPTLYFLVYDTPDPRQKVLDYFNAQLDQSPWQLQGTVSTSEFDSLQFAKADDADITGVVSIVRVGDDGHTSILVSLQDAGAFRQQTPVYHPAESLSPPKGFPSDVPLYDGATIISTVFLRQPGNESYLVDFITRDSADRVLTFYRQASADRGWTVLPGAPLGVAQRLDFHDANSDIQGSLLVDAFPQDSAFTEVKLQVQLNPNRTPVTPTTGSPPAAATPPPSSATPPAPAATASR
jgi:hypothetical protein